MNLCKKILPALLLLACAFAHAHAAPTLARTFLQGYNNSASATTLDVRLDFDSGGQAMNALYIGENLPLGWTFNRLVSENSGVASSNLLVGTKNNNMFECLWLKPPTNTAFTLTYRVNVPAFSTGEKTFSGEMDWALFESAPNTVTTTGEATLFAENQVRTPVLSPADGTRFNDSLVVTITCDTSGAVIRYTLDGTTPTTSSTLYASPFEISQACTVKARAFLSGKMDSEVASAFYDQALEIRESPMVGVRVDSILATFPNVPGGVYSLVKTSKDSLPAGLKIALVRDAVSGNYDVVLSGTPTSVNRTPLLVVYEVRLKEGASTKTVSTLEINFDAVASFPALAKAAYNGWISVPAPDPETGLGKITMAVSAKGAITGKLLLNGTSRTLKAAAFGGRSGNLLSAAVDVKAGTKKWGTLFFDLDPANGQVVNSRLDVLPAAEIFMCRNAWNDPGMPAFFTDAFAGYYTAQIPSDENVLAHPAETAPRGTGYLTLTLSAKGAARWSGKLADGRSFSGSGVLLHDPVSGAFTLPVIASYNSKKANFGAVVEIQRGFLKSGNTLVSHYGVWRNTDFKSVYSEGLDLRFPPIGGFGFQNFTRVAGGFYNKNANIAEHYKNEKLILENEPVDREFKNTSPARDGMNPPLTLLGNSSGGLAFSMPNDLKKENGVYNYNSSNPLGLTFRFTKATGLFTGKFGVYYDYDTSHVKKSVSYSGVLTPWRDPADMVALPEGGGYFLLNLGDKCQYLDARGAVKSYTFSKWSYGFWILSE